MSEVLNALQPPPQICKKCDLAIFEGHAYELGDDRWHIGCFKCFKCDKSLGCNSNFLVLGNGSLVCSSCSYSCKQCGKKIDDLAILTGDQAYCSNCFKCRVCKSKIEDLRYARTSKGLFCMSCHEDLIAKKRKHDLKRKQMALLSSSSRPSPHDEMDNPLAASPNTSRLSATSLSSQSKVNNIYQHRNPSSTSLLNKQLPPQPGSRGSAESHSISGSLTHTAPTATSSATTLESTAARNTAGQAPQTPNFEPTHNHTPLTTASSSRSAETGGSKLLSSAIPKVQVDSQPNLSYDIEEVNDSDDELHLRKMREKLERRFLNGSEEPDGAILDLIEAFSAPNTPSTIYNHTAASKASALSDTESIEQPRTNSSNGTATKNTLSDNLRTDASSLTSYETPLLRPETDETRSWTGEPASPHKNILLLSPNQFHDNDFHNARNVHNDSISHSLAVEDVARPRSAFTSPMAKANRQARVVETNEENTTTEFGSEGTGLEPRADDTPLSTPRKSLASRQSPPVSSPPPRLALPEVPSTPKLSEFDSQNRHQILGEASEPRGLGLDGIDMHRPRTLKSATPSVTNLEGPFMENSEVEGSIKSPPSRKTSVRSKLSIRHKRSTSNSSGGGFSSKMGLFKSRDESASQKGHIRHVSEGSVNGQAFTTPPLPFSSPLDQISRRDPHTRSTSDTNFITNMDSDSSRRDLEMRSLKFELYQLDSRRQALLAENMKLNSDKSKLLETLDTLSKRVSSDTQTKEVLTLELHTLTIQKRKLLEENESLKEDNRSLQEQVSRTRESLREANDGTASQHSDYQNETFESSNAIESINDEGAEAQRATRLKFWRRPKVTIANTQSQPSNQNIASHLHPSNGIPPGATAQRSGQAYPNAIAPSQSQSSTNDESQGALKVLNNFVTKSRSTTILDSFVNASSGPDVPLLTSSLQSRAIYENEKVPLIISRCIEEVEKRGLDMEGIYRLSGGNTAISAIENAFAGIPPNGVRDRKHMAKLNEVLGGDINAVTSALKRYLRKLPDPLIPFALYDSFIRIGQHRGDASELCEEFKARILNRLPSANKHAMYMIGKHLDKVNQLNAVNRMNFKNLSVVFAPTIARDATGEREMVDMGPRNDATEFLFSNFAKLFADYALDTA